MYIRHKPNDYTDPKTGHTGFTPDWRSDYEQTQRLRPGLTLHRLYETALLVVGRGEMTLDRRAILSAMIDAAK